MNPIPTPPETCITSPLTCAVVFLAAAACLDAAVALGCLIG